MTRFLISDRLCRDGVHPIPRFYLALVVPNVGISGWPIVYYTTKIGLSALGFPTFLYQSTPLVQCRILDELVTKAGRTTCSVRPAVVNGSR
jgi:hypothetical protein